VLWHDEANANIQYLPFVWLMGLTCVGGSSHPELSERIVDRLGSQLGEAALGKFSNGEKSVEIRMFPEYDRVY